MLAASLLPKGAIGVADKNLLCAVYRNNRARDGIAIPIKRGPEPVQWKRFVNRMYTPSGVFSHQ